MCGYKILTKKLTAKRVQKDAVVMVGCNAEKVIRGNFSCQLPFTSVPIDLPLLWLFIYYLVAHGCNCKLKLLSS